MRDVTYGRKIAQQNPSPNRGTVRDQGQIFPTLWFKNRETGPIQGEEKYQLELVIFFVDDCEISFLRFGLKTAGLFKDRKIPHLITPYFFAYDCTIVSHEIQKTSFLPLYKYHYFSCLKGSF